MKEKRFFVGNVIVTSVNECISENGIIFALIKAGKLVNFKQTNMRLFFTKRELRLRKNRIVMMIACMAVLLAIYIILTWPKKVVPEAPVVIVEPAHTENARLPTILKLARKQPPRSGTRALHLNVGGARALRAHTKKPSRVGRLSRVVAEGLFYFAFPLSKCFTASSISCLPSFGSRTFMWSRTAALAGASSSSV